MSSVGWNLSRHDPRHGHGLHASKAASPGHTVHGLGVPAPLGSGLVVVDVVVVVVVAVVVAAVSVVAPHTTAAQLVKSSSAAITGDIVLRVCVQTRVLGRARCSRVVSRACMVFGAQLLVNGVPYV